MTVRFNNIEEYQSEEDDDLDSYDVNSMDSISITLPDQIKVASNSKQVKLIPKLDLTYVKNKYHSEQIKTTPDKSDKTLTKTEEYVEKLKSEIKDLKKKVEILATKSEIY